MARRLSSIPVVPLVAGLLLALVAAVTLFWYASPKLLSRYMAAFGPEVQINSVLRLHEAETKLAAAKTEYDRWITLGDVAMARAAFADRVDADVLAKELLAMAQQPAFRNDWNYGNAVHRANSSLGHIALRNGDKAAARDYLLASVNTQGSPQMNSFGPNMLLAKEMLDANEQDAVLQYLTRCRTFWTMGHDNLDVWTQMIRDGKRPRFGPNLLY